MDLSNPWLLNSCMNLLGLGVFEESIAKPGCIKRCVLDLSDLLGATWILRGGGGGGGGLQILNMFWNARTQGSPNSARMSVLDLWEVIDLQGATWVLGPEP